MHEKEKIYENASVPVIHDPSNLLAPAILSYPHKPVVGGSPTTPVYYGRRTTGKPKEIA